MKHFKIEEFACNCCGEVKMVDHFLSMIDQARDFAGVKFIIVSGYRCQKHNTDVGSTSQNHPGGKASDIYCRSGPARLKIVRSLIKAGFVRLGIGPTFIHCDISDYTSSIWLY
jgi:uncharacterized protein YcbK (DUF882 family)